MAMASIAQDSDALVPSSYRLTRRELFPLVGAATLVAALGPAPLVHARGERSSGARSSQAVRRFVYVGTYTSPNTAPGGVAPSTAVGIYVFQMDPETGGLTPVQVVPDVPNPSFLAIDARQRH